MRTLDTNVIVRLLVGDDPQQTPIAERAFLAAVANGGVYLPDVVLAEVAWVLRGYDLDRQTRHALLDRLVRTRGVSVDDIDAVIDALENFRQGGDLADHKKREAPAGAPPARWPQKGMRASSAGLTAMGGWSRCCSNSTWAAISASRGQRSPQNTRSSSSWQENCCRRALRDREAIGGLRVGPLSRRGWVKGPSTTGMRSAAQPTSITAGSSHP
jgi:predicted nucleic-acid-binding protein